MGNSLAEDLLVLAFDGRTGERLIHFSSLDVVLAAAVLLDLVSAGALRIDNPHETSHGGRLRTTGEAVADPLLAGIATYVDGMKTPKVIPGLLGARNLHNRARELREALLDRLDRDGKLRKEEFYTVLGLVYEPRWHVVDVRAREALLRRVRHTVVTDRLPDRHTAALVGLLSLADLLVTLLPDVDKRYVRARGAEIRAGDWAAEAAEA